MNSADRQIVLDTETTGLDPKAGDRIVEICCVEIVDLERTGQTYQSYINPEREMSTEASEITGLKDDFLKDSPVFADVVSDFTAFIGDAPLVIHNAPFDIGFINSELARVGLPPLDPARIIDTLEMARKKFPGQPNNLDALCARLGIDNSSRTLHGALLDAEILVDVYVELSGGRQRGLGFKDDSPTRASARAASAHLTPGDNQRPPRPHAPTKEEQTAHAAFVKEYLTDPIWSRDTFDAGR